MWLQRLIHFVLRRRALRAILLGGCLGVLIDVDHAIARFVFPGPAYTPELARFLHFPIAINSLFVLGGIGAYFLGLYVYWALVFVLRGKHEKNNN